MAIQSANPLPGRDEQPTRVRYLVVALTMLTAVFLYLDRLCIAPAERFIKEDLGLSNGQIALVMFAAFLTYALAQVPAGFLSDRYGARRMLTLYVLLWSLFTGLTGLATGFVTLMLMRFGFGVAQAGAYPTCAGLVANWVPLTARGIASSLVAVGGRFGGFVAPLLTALLIVQFVPPATPSRFGPDDLLDFPWLCQRFCEEPVDVGTRILDGLPPQAKERVLRYAKEVRAQKERGPSKNQGLVGLSLPEPTAAERAVVAGRLNELLRDPALREAPYFRGVALPREASALLTVPVEQLSPEQLERLNRLLLEAAYSQGVRKVYGLGWRPVMIVFGVAGVLVAGLFWLGVRDRPDQHPLCNAAEVALVEDGRPRDGGAAPRGVPLGPLLRSGSMWLMCLSQVGTNIGWVFLVTWLPRYLAEAHGLPIEERGVLASMPLLVGWAGMLAGGWATDRLTRAVGVRWGRALPVALSRFAAVGAYAACLLDLNPYAATLAFAVVAFATDFGSPATWAFTLDVGGRNVGSVLGWGNMWGNLGAAVSPVLLNGLLDASGGKWEVVFLACGAAFLVSGVAALGIDATKRIG